ncbi:MAG: adenylyltransferase/cytidyltransferase family protein [Cyanobacteria bacterium]|nr:adenylyltransferase/cytidyltransferase family protein [Cyanobacteriota bacterium]
MGRVLSFDDLLKEREAFALAGKQVVTTNGCFDLLHVGHLRYLQAAKQTGDVLIVLLNSDTSVSALKGPTRPINTEADRAEILAGLSCVDYVCIFDAQSPEQWLVKLHPDVHVKGGDYDQETLPEAKALQAVGTRLVFIPTVPGRSTTSLLARANA